MREAKERAFQPGIFGGPRELPIELPEPMPAPAPESRIVYVTLDLEEQDHVRRVAEKVAARYESGMDERGRKATMKYLPPGVSIRDMNLQGFGAELAAALVLELPWNEGKRGKPDVGRNVEVRATRFDDGHLTLHSWDKLSRIFILAAGRFPTYRLAGWIDGASGVAVGSLYAPGQKYPYRPGVTGTASATGLWIVEQTKLRPMRALEVRKP